MKVFACSISSALLAVASLLLAADVVVALPSRETAITPNKQPPHESRFPLLHIIGSIDGVTVDHFGSVQEVFAQLDAEDNSFKLADIDAIIKSASAAIYTVEKREMTDINCSPLIGQNYNDAHGKAIWDGIDYLHTGGMTCHVGPASCVRISCSWDSAIYLCNNNTEGPNRELRRSCTSLAYYVKALYDLCWYQHWWEFTSTGHVGGQVWDRKNWNLLVRKDKC